MVQIGNVPEIVAVKAELSSLQKKGLIKEWELPYENLLTRLDAAIFFLTPKNKSDLDDIWQVLQRTPGFTSKENGGSKLSSLDWQVQFNAKQSIG